AGEPIERRVADRVDRVGAQDRVALGGVEERADDRVALVPPAPGAPDRVEHDRHRLVSVGGVAARGAVVTTPKGPHEPAAGWWELFGILGGGGEELTAWFPWEPAPGRGLEERIGSHHPHTGHV